MTKEELLNDLSEMLPEDADIQFGTITFLNSEFECYHYDTETRSVTE